MGCLLQNLEVYSLTSFFIILQIYLQNKDLFANYMNISVFLEHVLSTSHHEVKGQIQCVPWSVSSSGTLLIGLYRGKCAVIPKPELFTISVQWSVLWHRGSVVSTGLCIFLSPQTCQVHYNLQKPWSIPGSLFTQQPLANRQWRILDSQHEKVGFSFLSDCRWFST